MTFSVSLVVKPVLVKADRAWNRASGVESPVNVNATVATRTTMIDTTIITISEMIANMLLLDSFF